MKKTLITLALALLTSLSVGAVGCQQTNPDKSSSSISSQNSSSSEISSSQESSSSSIEESSSSIEDTSSEETSSSSEETSSSTEDSSSSEENSSSQQSKFTVTWVIDESNQIDTEVDYGCSPTYPDATPTKPATQESKFTFAGWALSEGGEVVDLTNQTITTEGVIYYAVFTATPQQYTITWAEETSASDQTLDYGTQITAPMVNPTKVLSDEHSTTTYEFAGWADKDGNLVTDFGTVSQDVTYYAVFDNATSVWKGTYPNTASGYSFNGTGTQNDPWLIESATDFAALSSLSQGKDYGTNSQYYKLVAKLDLTAGNWQPICFTGTYGWPSGGFKFFNANFDGNGKTITANLNQIAAFGMGLFGGLGGTIKNLTLNGTFSVGGHSGALIGKVNDGAYIENVVNNATVIASAEQVGGIAGGTVDNAKITFKNCVNNGSVTGQKTHVAGILGQGWASVNYINCENTGDISGLSTVGGICGELWLNSSLQNCLNSGTIKAGSVTATTDYGIKEIYTGNLVGFNHIPFTITWIINGDTSTTQVLAGETPTYSGTPNIEDDEFRYTFVGWSKTENGEIITLAPIMSQETYYAVFTKATLYEINFVVNGVTTTIKTPENEIPVYTGELDKEGWKFLGWSKTENSNEVVELEKPTKSETYYAVYEEVTQTFTITWHINGETSTSTLKYGATPTHEDATWDGHDFSGWSKTENGELVDLKEERVTTNQDYYAIFDRLKESEFGALPMHIGGPNSIASTFRARIDFTFKLKAGAKFTFIGTAEQLAFYKWTVNEESENIHNFTANKNNDIDAGWNIKPDATNGNGWKNGGTEYSTTQYTTQSECYPIIVFARTDGKAFTEDDLFILKSMFKVEGTKATMYNDGELTTDEYNRQSVGLGSHPNQVQLNRARIMFSVRMAAGTKITFKGDTSVYNWAIVETGTHYDSSKYVDTGWIKNNNPYYSQIDGAYLVLTICKVGNPDLTSEDLKTIHSLFTVEGTKRTTFAQFEQKDYEIKSINHRGFNLLAPENTLEAYRLSYLQGFKYVECDISFTKDGIPVLLHDDTIDRTSNGTGAIKDLTLAEARQYDYGSWFSAEWAGVQIPTLEEFLMLCKEYNLHPYIEIKWNNSFSLTDAQAKVLVDLVETCGMTGNVSYISFNTESLGFIKNYDPTARLGCVISSTVTQDHINKALALKTDTNEVFIDVYVSQGATGHNTVTLCQSAGIPLEVWTADGATIDTLDPYVSGVSSEYTIAGKYLEK